MLLLEGDVDRLKLENERFQCFYKRAFARKSETDTNESVTGDIADPVVSPLSSQNKNTSPSTSSVLDLTPDTDSVDATIEVSSTFAADIYCEPNISFESNSEDEFDSGDESDSEDESDSLESVISTINDAVPPQTKKEEKRQYVLQTFNSLTPKDTEAERRGYPTTLSEHCKAEDEVFVPSKVSEKYNLCENAVSRMFRNDSAYMKQICEIYYLSSIVWEPPQKKI